MYNLFLFHDLIQSFQKSFFLYINIYQCFLKPWSIATVRKKFKIVYIQTNKKLTLETIRKW